MTSPGERIRYLRQLSNMSQEELGRRVGVQRAAINKYEVGSVTNIPLTTIEKIAKVFDVSPTYIVGWNGEESNPLAVEIKVLQSIQRIYGKDAVAILESYVTLNSIGKKRARQCLEDLEQLYGIDLVDV